MDAKPVVLKVLLQHRHLQTHRAFWRFKTALDGVKHVGQDSSVLFSWPSWPR